MITLKSQTLSTGSGIRQVLANLEEHLAILTCKTLTS